MIALHFVLLFEMTDDGFDSRAPAQQRLQCPLKPLAAGDVDGDTCRVMRRAFEAAIHERCDRPDFGRPLDLSDGGPERPPLLTALHNRHEPPSTRTPGRA